MKEASLGAGEERAADLCQRMCLVQLQWACLPFPGDLGLATPTGPCSVLVRSSFGSRERSLAPSGAGAPPPQQGGSRAELGSPGESRAGAGASTETGNLWEAGPWLLLAAGL